MPRDSCAWHAWHAHAWHGALHVLSTGSAQRSMQVSCIIIGFPEACSPPLALGGCANMRSRTARRSATASSMPAAWYGRQRLLHGSPEHGAASSPCHQRPPYERRLNQLAACQPCDMGRARRGATWHGMVTQWHGVSLQGVAGRDGTATSRNMAWHGIACQSRKRAGHGS